jgi:hypothetical protein
MAKSLSPQTTKPVRPTPAPTKKFLRSINPILHFPVMLDWQRNVETRLPDLPNGQRVTYPMSGAGVMLPLRYENGYAAEILLCGGSEVSCVAFRIGISPNIIENLLRP